jgi:hypothetical protein
MVLVLAFGSILLLAVLLSDLANEASCRRPSSFLSPTLFSAMAFSGVLHFEPCYLVEQFLELALFVSCILRSPPCDCECRLILKEPFYVQKAYTFFYDCNDCAHRVVRGVPLERES